MSRYPAVSVTGPDFVRDINAYAEALAESADDSGEFLSERVELAFACRGGRDCALARRWYEWFRDGFCTTNRRRDLVGKFSVSDEGVDYEKRAYSDICADSRYRSAHMCMISWYYGNGKKIRKPDVEEFARLCGLDYSGLPDYREDMIDYDMYI